MRPIDTAGHEPPAYPTHSWYVAATSDEVTSSPLGRRAVDTGLVLYRTSDGTPVVLEDRDAHNAYPLSLGRVEQDLIVSSYSGFAYAADGACVRVPTQTKIPYDARVRSFPVREQDGLIWVWFADPRLAGLRKPPAMSWLVDDGWSTFGDTCTTRANVMLLHENFADITHVAVVAPGFAPTVLSAGPTPLLEVEVTETAVSFGRSYPPAQLASWHAALLGVENDAVFAQREEGRFVSPGLWVNTWEVDLDGGSAATFRFTHAVTPVNAGSTRHVWRVSRNFASGGETSAQIAPLFDHYYASVSSILETMQGVLSLDGPRPDVHVAADAAAVQVRKIVNRMVADEQLGGTR